MLHGRRLREMYMVGRSFHVELLSINYDQGRLMSSPNHFYLYMIWLWNKRSTRKTIFDRVDRWCDKSLSSGMSNLWWFHYLRVLVDSVAYSVKLIGSTCLRLEETNLDLWLRNHGNHRNSISIPTNGANVRFENKITIG